MSILPINNDLSICSPFCDYLNITSPKDNQYSIMAHLKPFLDMCGCLESYEGTYNMPQSSGTFKVSVRGQVSIFSASGGFLGALRAKGLYDSYLMIFADYEYRISMMHATVDFRVDAPGYITDLYQKASNEQVRLTSKFIKPQNVKQIISRNDFGVDTGTVYLGNRANADVWAKIYDKKQERQSRGDFTYPPTLRIEIAFQSDIGASLKDASNPFDIFYHYAQHSLVIPPDSFKGWVSYGQGFFTPKTQSNITPWQQIKSIVDNSNDIKRSFDLACLSYGEDALSEVMRLIRRRFRLYKKTLAI